MLGCFAASLAILSSDRTFFWLLSRSSYQDRKAGLNHFTQSGIAFAGIKYDHAVDALALGEI